MCRDVSYQNRFITCLINVAIQRFKNTLLLKLNVGCSVTEKLRWEYLLYNQSFWIQDIHWCNVQVSSRIIYITCIYILYIYMNMFYILYIHHTYISISSNFLSFLLWQFGVMFSILDDLGRLSISDQNSAAISIPKVWTNVTSKSWFFLPSSVYLLFKRFFTSSFSDSIFSNSLGCIWIRNTKSSPHLNVCVCVFFYFGTGITTKNSHMFNHYPSTDNAQIATGIPPFQEHLQNGQNVPALLIPKILPLCLKAWQILVYLPCLLRKIAVVSFVLPNKK